MTLNRSVRRKADPTSQKTRRGKCARIIAGRLRSAEARTRSLAAAISYTTKIVIAASGRETAYDYAVSPFDMVMLNSQVRRALDEELETASDAPPPNWFMNDVLEGAYRQGAVEENVRTNRMIEALILAGVISDPFVSGVDPERLVLSEPYGRTLRRLIVRNHGNIKTLSSETAAKVIRQINDDLIAGRSPAEIGARIAQRFEVARKSAQRIADTEINRAYNDGKMTVAREIGDRTGRRTAVMHISALLPTTRAHHAARHGRVYSVEDQEAWWSEGANRINCHCSVTTVFMEDDGSVYPAEDKATLEEEREFFSR